VLRVLVVILLMAVSAFQVVRTAVATAFIKTDPQIAARTWQGHPRVKLALAMEEIGHAAAAGQTAPPETLINAMQAAASGPLLSDPFLIEGASALSRGQSERAAKLFEEARRRNPRSAAARYFLAQYYLQTGRAAQGLEEASALARLVPGAGGALVPALARYAREPGAKPNLQKLFAQDPGLAGQVLLELARDASNARLVMSLAGPGFGAEAGEVPAWQTQLLRSLIGSGEFAQAHALWRRMSGVREGSRGLFNPQFEKIAAPAPFNWTFGSGKFGVAEPAPAGKMRVMYYGRDDADFANQLLLLPPGTYELRMQVSWENRSADSSGLSWKLTCSPVGGLLLGLPLEKADRRSGLLNGRFTVPANCPAQQLSLVGVAPELPAAEQVTVSNLWLIGGGR
jgi:tetratricopeptide (TPR) repeat protein